MYIFGYITTVFIQNLYILVKFFGKNFIFRVKSKIFLVFQDQMYIFGYKTTLFIQNLYILVKFFGKNFIFRVKSTNCLGFRDQMYILVYKTTVFIQNLYILVKFFIKNFIFSVKSTIFLFFRTKCTFLGTKLQFLSKICTFWWNVLAKTSFLVYKVQFFGFSGPNVHFWVQNYSFYPKFVHFGEMFWQKLHF